MVLKLLYKAKQGLKFEFEKVDQICNPSKHFSLLLLSSTNEIFESTSGSAAMRQQMAKRQVSEMAFTFAAPNGVLYDRANIKQVRSL